MKLFVIVSLSLFALVACLPDVSTETSELEARAILEDEMINICRGSQSSEGLNRTLEILDAARVSPTRDFWVFKVTPSVATGELEALVFPSKIVTGSYVRYMKTRVCK